MPLIFQHKIYRQDLQANPDVIYIFGDNDVGIGLGGQAKEMRGEPNALGIPTKIRPTNQPDSFYTDNDIVKVTTALTKVYDLLINGRTVIMPLYGIGTGLARLEKYAPKIDQLIKSTTMYWASRFAP